MRIGIDATPVTNRSGTGYYAQKLIEFLGRADSENEYILFCPSGYPKQLEHPGMFEYPNFHIIEVNATTQLRQFAWKQFELPRQIQRLKIDLIHFTSFIASLAGDARAVLTVHDLCFALFPETFPPLRRSYYRYVIPRSVRRCDAVIVDSDSTKRDIQAHITPRKELVHAIHLGVDPVSFYHVSDESARARLREKYSLPGDFILYVGTLEPRKNLPRLIRAFAYGVVSKGLSQHLVIAGRKGWMFGEIFRQVRTLNLMDRVCFPGYVESSDLAALYSMARVFVYPSLYEGFGLPCLEAMSCGTPVIASNRSSLPEVVGDCALMVEPTSVESIAEQLKKVCSDDDCHDMLSEQGPRRASRFSWLTTAKKTVEAYMSTFQRAQ